MCYNDCTMDFSGFAGKRICVAVSGGGDSVALLHYLKTLAPEKGFSLSALHCEHGIRGEESKRDMAFAQALCKEWGIPLTLFEEDCVARAKRDKQSLETAARAFRRECYDRLLRSGEVDYIATAHHQKDAAETVLFRLARGTALGGAAGIREREEGYIRPFLHRSKREILAYLAENGLAYCEDSTNLQTEATRNKIRLEVLPLLEDAVPGATENIARFAARALEDDEYLSRLAEPLVERAEGSITVLFCAEKPLFTRACLTALKALGLEKDYTATHLSAAFALQDSQRGAAIDLPCNIRAEKGERGILFALAKQENFGERAEEKPFGIEGFEGGRYAVNVASTPISEGYIGRELCLDLQKIPPSAVFRFRREGDFIERFGSGKKSLKKFFNEEKIPPMERAYIPLIAEGEGNEVFAVCGVEISEKIKTDSDTESVAYLYVQRRR